MTIRMKDNSCPCCGNAEFELRGLELDVSGLTLKLNCHNQECAARIDTKVYRDTKEGPLLLAREIIDQQLKAWGIE